MYDRYKTKKRKWRFLRFLIIAVLFSIIFYTGYSYRQQLTFWKYNTNKLHKELKKILSIKDRKQRLDDLLALRDKFTLYKQEKATDIDAFLLSGELFYRIGEARFPCGFSELVINEKIISAGPAAQKEFIQAIKDFKKAQALMSDGPLPEKYAFMLARSCLYTGYGSPGSIFKILRPACNPDTLQKIEDVRFYGILKILGKDTDAGIALLARKGAVNESVQGRLFYAVAQKMAGKYTGALLTYKDILTRVTDPAIKKLIFTGLGKIYFKQSLYKESLANFNQALTIDAGDTESKIWMGKNYAAMGQKDKAQAIWTEVLTTDKDNSEVKRLLEVM